MFGDLQGRRRPLADESSIGNDVVKRAAQNRDRVVGLAHGHSRLLFDACYNNVTSASEAWFTASDGICDAFQISTGNSGLALLIAVVNEQLLAARSPSPWTQNGYSMMPARSAGAASAGPSPPAVSSAKKMTRIMTSQSCRLDTLTDGGMSSRPGQTRKRYFS